MSYMASINQVKCKHPGLVTRTPEPGHIHVKCGLPLSHAGLHASIELGYLTRWLDSDLATITNYYKYDGPLTAREGSGTVSTRPLPWHVRLRNKTEELVKRISFKTVK